MNMINRVIKDYYHLCSNRANKILNNTPMGRFGQAEELIGDLLFLTDEKAASFVNAVVLPIDGVFNAYSGF